MLANITIEEKANEIADAIHHVMGSELGLQTPVRYLLTRDGNFVFVIGVMDAQNLRGSMSKYTQESLLHQLSTAVGGLPVAISNHSGLRYAVSMTKPRLPRNIELNVLPREHDVIPFGVTLRGEAHFHAKKIVNVIVAGSQDSGKSTFLQLLAHVNRAHQAKLYLADPYAHTFNPDVWNRFSALPVAGEGRDVLRLIEAMQAEIENRSALFRSSAVGGIPPNDVDEYRELTGERLPRLWLIGDEMNAFMGDRVVQERMAELARGGRKWGVNVVLAAHNWRKDEIPSGVSAMFQTRLCLRVADNTSGPVTLGDSQRGKEPMKFRTAGRAILFCVGQYQKVQLYYVSPDQQREWLGSAVSDQPSAINPLPEEELTIVMKAINERDGKMTGEFLMEEGLSDTGARKLAERYELRGWLERDPRQGNARVVTERLRALVTPTPLPSASPQMDGTSTVNLGGESTNRQSQQSAPKPSQSPQSPHQSPQTLDLAGGIV